jgi:hypothetical protein
MTSRTQQRRPAGFPDGGQFASADLTESDLDLAAEAHDDSAPVFNGAETADSSRSLLRTALWSSCDDGGTPLDAAGYTPDDIHPDTREEMEGDLRDFVESNAEPIRRLRDNFADCTPERIAHDFWLTRNRHGAGFWDRGYGEDGDALTEAAHAYGTVDLCVGDDGRLRS